MSKFASFGEYPALSLDAAEAALLTAWATLNRFHTDLVLVGGLAVKYLTKRGTDLLPGPVTMDVDFGITLAAEGGQYGTIADDLTGQGFKRTEQGRFVRMFGQMPLYIDFLTEHPNAPRGTANVDGVAASVFPGIERALATRRNVEIEGKDLFGVTQKTSIPVAGIGSLLVLKLNAFDDRQQPKDAYDVLLATSRFVEGPETAIAAFHAEEKANNRAFPRAAAALRNHFFDINQSGPIRCAEFVLKGGDAAGTAERRRQIQEQTVTIGRALAAATGADYTTHP
jgi:hypothetical protein